MSERESEVRTVLIDYICDECKTGVMENHDNIMLLSSPPRWTYICNHCGASKTIAAKYPRIEYRRITL